MTALDFHTRLLRMLEDGLIDSGAEVFAESKDGVSLVIAIDPINKDLGKVNVLPSVALCFGRIT